LIELTDEMARKIGRASQILSGLTRVASKDCDWLQRNPDLHAEILDLQSDMRRSAAQVTGENDLGAYLIEAQAVGTRLGELFHVEEKPELRASRA
jgi:hypothetical protein